MVSELKEFKKKHGHANPPSKRKEFKSLGFWCITQRLNYKNKTLSQEKIDILNSLDFDWNPLETIWQKRFSELKEFKKNHGHLKPSRINGEFKSLGFWVMKQRNDHKNGNLSSERFKLLDKIGFRWI